MPGWVVGAALVGATGWNLLTWWLGLPSSSSHALIGGLGGAALAAGAGVHWRGILAKVVVPMLLSPIVGLLLGFVVMTAILWAFRRRQPARVQRGFRYAQTVSAAAMAFGHGLQDAAKTAGVVVRREDLLGRKRGTVQNERVGPTAGRQRALGGEPSGPSWPKRQRQPVDRRGAEVAQRRHRVVVALLDEAAAG